MRVTLETTHDEHAPEAQPIRPAVTAEALGTYTLVLFGTGAVHVAVLTGAQAGIGQVAAVWAVAVALAIWIASSRSGAHLNPAVTLACAVWREFGWRRVPAYLAAQTTGAFLAAATLYLLFAGTLVSFEHSQGITRGTEGSARSAMVYGEYFPNPGAPAAVRISEAQAMLAEGLGTFFLVLGIFALTDPRNKRRPPTALAPLAIGALVAMLICVIAPLTQAGLNPARDFGPRLLAWLVGWGRIAIPGPRGGFFVVYILAPLVGGVLGGGLWECLAGATGWSPRQRAEREALCLRCD